MIYKLRIWDSMNYKILYATNHILIGWLYILVGLVGGSIGYGLSILLRFELSGISSSER